MTSVPLQRLFNSSTFCAVAEKTGHVNVVTQACITPTSTPASFLVFTALAYGRRFSLPPQRIEFRSHENSRPRTIFHYTNDAVTHPLLVLILSNAFRDGESEFA
jgi:hypothetical protein